MENEMLLCSLTRLLGGASYFLLMFFHLHWNDFLLAFGAFVVVILHVFLKNIVKYKIFNIVILKVFNFKRKIKIVISTSKLGSIYLKKYKFKLKLRFDIKIFDKKNMF